METKGHLLSNPGLRGHSVGENNILSRYVVAYHKPEMIGWIWEISFPTWAEASKWYQNNEQPDTEYRIIDQSDNDTILHLE